jgi:hypothetical protein
MKKFLFLVMLITVATNSFGQTDNQSENFKKLDWLIGTWERTNVKPGRAAHERWEKISENELLGYGASLQGKDTVFMEKLRIVTKQDSIVYVADVPENKKPVYFRLTEITNSGFICENAKHDFPKKISYQLEGKKLKARTSGDGKAIDFLFERK